MAQIELKYVNAFSQALARLYEPGSVSQLPERFFEVIQKVAPGHLIHISLTQPGLGAVDAYMSLPAHRELMALAEQREEVQRMPGVADSSFYLKAETAPTSFHDLMDRRTLERTVLWQSFCHPLELEHDLSINFHRTENLFYTISTSRKGRAYLAEERLLLQLLQPHLQQRFQQMRLEEPEHPLSQMAGTVSPAYWLVCSGNGRVLATGPGLTGVLSESGLRLGSDLPDPWLRWLKAQLVPHAPEFKPVALVLATGKIRIRIHALINRHSDEHRLIFETLSGKNVLTPRESEVAEWVSEGKTNSEIAMLLGISRGTVKIHVERILEKLGVENRTAAARAWQGWKRIGSRI